METIRKVILVILLAALTHRLTKFILALGMHKPIYNHTPGPNHLVSGIVNGSEDIAISSSGFAFISSGLRTMLNNEAGVTGKILTFDLNHHNDGAKEIELVGESSPKTLNPIGLDIWEDKETGKVLLFVVNRDFDGSGGSAIEVFDFKKETHQLIHQKSIHHPKIYCPNSIIATSENTFYVTNDGYFNEGVLRFLEIVLLLPTGSVMYYDGKDAEKVSDGFGMANGINISPDKQYLYVASTFEQHIRVYYLHTETKLELKKTIPVASLVDNIKVQADTGDLWIGANYNGYKFIFDKGRAKGVAQVLWIHFEDNLDYNLKEVLMDDGKILQGSSVASYYHGNLLVGTANGKMLYCEVLAF